MSPRKVRILLLVAAVVFCAGLTLAQVQFSADILELQKPDVNKEDLLR